jgi:hypothetical protein
MSPECSVTYVSGMDTRNVWSALKDDFRTLLTIQDGALATLAYVEGVP